MYIDWAQSSFSILGYSTYVGERGTELVFSVENIQ